MPALNARSTIQLAVRSTLLALPPNGRLLVTDDGSTDGTTEILSGFQDARLTVFRNSTPLGVAATLNSLLNRAVTQHVSRMDADDVSFPHRFVSQRAHLGDDCDLTFSTVINFGDSPRGWKPAIPIGISPEAMPFFLLIGNPLGHSAMYGSAPALRTNHGYVAGPAEDYDLWMRLVAAGHRLRRTAAPLIAYRHHRTQITKAADWRVRVARDPQLRSSHRALSHSVGWEGPDFFDLAVQGARTPADRKTLEDLARFFATRCRHLSSVEQQHLKYQLGKLKR
ncbi:glycosyltransferase family 2 protein [Pseudarthrobacter sp. NPDC092439]|uniref:glycosyltransferase family 2 protein n=1 Tax=unclassified Pseudarthrobacter TaxID=2647000 RepID=UPI00381D3F67